MTKRAVPLPPVFARRARRIYWVVTKHGAHNEPQAMTSIAATLRWIAERPHLEDPAIYCEDRPAWTLARRQPARRRGGR